MRAYSTTRDALLVEIDHGCENFRMPDDTLETISNHFGPALVSIGPYRRISFAEAWKNPALRQRVIDAGLRALHRERITGQAPSVANEPVAMIAALLHRMLRQGYR